MNTEYEVSVQEAATDKYHALLCTEELGSVINFVSEWVTLEKSDLRIIIEVVRV